MLDTHGKKYYNNKVANDGYTWELSSAGRASALQAEGHRFEPYSSHWYGRVVQLVRMPACHAGGRGFEPLLGRHSLRIAQCSPQDYKSKLNMPL